jgi:hypothetical protein
MATLRSVTNFMTEVYEFYKGEDEFTPLFDQYDVGFPLAWMLYYGYANATDSGVANIWEAWDAMCKHMNIDPHNDFESIAEMNDALEGAPEFAEDRLG